ncbi:MAG: histidine kinase [Bacteroidota bacterium]
MKKISITEKMILWFLMLGLASIAVISGFSYHRAKDSLIRRTYDQLTSVKAAKKNSMERFFADRSRETGLVAKSSDIMKMLSILDEHFVEQNREEKLTESQLENEYNRFLSRYISGCGYYDNVFLVRSDGNYIKIDASSVGSGKRFSFGVLAQGNLRTVFDKVTRHNQPVTCDLSLDTLDMNPAIYIGTPIAPGAGILPAVLVFGISINAINSIMLEVDPKNGLGESGETYLVGSDSLMRSSSRFRENSVFRTRVATKAIRDGFSGIDSTSRYPDYRNIPVYGSYSKLNIPGLDWVIAAEIDVNEAMVPIKTLMYEIIFITVFIALALFIFTWIISKQITRPIVKLKVAADCITKGNYNINIAETSKDEIGALTATFNKMAAHIREQTSELKEREERLVHFYDATLDGIILHNDGVPMLINQALTRLTGFTEEELMTMRFNDFIVPGTKRSFKLPINPYTYETQAVRKNGTKFPVEIQESAIELKGSMIKASVIRDISRRVAVENQLKAERQMRLSWVIDGQEIERQRLSRELHDGLGQRLVAFKLKLESVLGTDEQRALKTIVELRDLFDGTIDEIRRISNDLQPAGLLEFGIVTGLSKLCTDASEQTGISVQFESESIHETLSKKNITYLYRIAQEAINNSVKHASANLIKVELKFNDGFVCLTVSDDGKGFKTGKTHPYVGNGIYNMRERASLLQGTIDISSEPGKGTVIMVKIPIS